MSSSAVPSLPERIRVRRGSSVGERCGREARELDVVRLLRPVRPVTHRARALGGRPDRAGEEKARQVARACGAQCLARALHERASLATVEAVDRVAPEVDDLGQGSGRMRRA